MDTFALVVGVMSDTLVFYHQLRKEDECNNLRESLWEYFSLGISHLFSQPQWAVIKKNVRHFV